MTAPFDPQDAVLVGIIIAPHGIAGACSAECLSDNPRRFIAGAQFFDSLGNIHHLQQASRHKGRLLLYFDGVTTRDEAEKLRGRELYIKEADSATLPEGEYYDYQLIGLTVYDQGEDIGRLADILHYSANDIFVVRNAENKDTLIPALKALITKIDLAAASMYVELPPGLREN